jgi:hypothetical protein
MLPKGMPNEEDATLKARPTRALATIVCGVVFSALQ